MRHPAAARLLTKTLLLPVTLSLFGLSVVTLKFKEGTDSFKARQNFSQYLAQANLPTGIQPALSPDSDATGEIMRFRLVGDGVDLTTLKSYQDYDITKELKHVQGVADVSSFGGKVKEYHIVPSPAKPVFPSSLRAARNSWSSTLV